MSLFHIFHFSYAFQFVPFAINTTTSNIIGISGYYEDGLVRMTLFMEYIPCLQLFSLTLRNLIKHLTYYGFAAYFHASNLFIHLLKEY